MREGKGFVKEEPVGQDCVFSPQLLPTTSASVFHHLHHQTANHPFHVHQTLVRTMADVFQKRVILIASAQRGSMDITVKSTQMTAMRGMDSHTEERCQKLKKGTNVSTGILSLFWIKDLFLQLHLHLVKAWDRTTSAETLMEIRSHGAL